MDIQIIAQNPRMIKAHQLIADNAVRQLAEPRRYAVGSKAYTVDLARSTPACTCPDAKYRKTYCKHIISSRLYTLIPAEIEQFLARRSDVNIEQFVSRMERETNFWKKALTFSQLESAKAAWAGAMLATAQRMMQNPVTVVEEKSQASTLAFQVQYFWGNSHGAELLQEDFLITRSEDEIDRANIQINTGNGFRPIRIQMGRGNMPFSDTPHLDALAEMIQYVEELRIDTQTISTYDWHEHSKYNRHTNSEQLYRASVYKAAS